MGYNHVLLLQNLLFACYVLIKVGAKVKTHYGGQKMLSQIFFFNIVWLSTFTKLILKEVFINYTQNKVIWLWNNAIFKRKNMFKLKNIFIKI
jgi:hypothetical protein